MARAVSSTDPHRPVAAWRHLGLLLLLGLCIPVHAAADLEQVIAGSHRSAENRARDAYRHPAQTLRFFEIEPHHRVVEVWPSGGWYAEILAPYLRDQGQYIAASFAVDEKITPKWRRQVHAQLLDKFTADPKRYARVAVSALGPLKAWTAAPAASADRVLTFRNVHNWLKGGYERQMFSALHAALKPGGMLGVVEHRARPGTRLAQMKASGYVTEAYVVALAKQAGFEVAGRSQINANPKDSAAHPKGVWTLPPRLLLGDKDRAKYLAIGESDRMTLKFRKPAQSSGS